MAERAKPRSSFFARMAEALAHVPEGTGRNSIQMTSFKPMGGYQFGMDIGKIRRNKRRRQQWARG